MKKVIVTIFAFLYLAVSCGATVHLHFCMGKLVEWSLCYGKNDGKCSKCGMVKSAEKKGCCKDVYKFVKIEKDQKLTKIANTMQLLSGAVIVSFVETPVVPVLPVVMGYSDSNAPPRSPLIVIFLRNCVFLI